MTVEIYDDSDEVASIEILIKIWCHCAWKSSFAYVIGKYPTTLSCLFAYFIGSSPPPIESSPVAPTSYSFA